MRRIIRFALLALVVVLIVIQFVPYGRDHQNHKVAQTPKWKGRDTARFVETACGDCHSNKTHWPWYASVAPASWLVQHDVDGGRKKFNFTEWNKPQPDAQEIAHEVNSGSMPPLQYRAIHSAARLSKNEKRSLVDGMLATYKADPPKIRKDKGEGG